jgi:hypothetical protein
LAYSFVLPRRKTGILQLHYYRTHNSERVAAALAESMLQLTKVVEKKLILE